MLDDPYDLYVVPPTGATAAVTLTGAGSEKFTFVKTGIGPLSSTYRYSVSSSHYVDMLMSRQIGKRNRYTVRLTETELVPDPINSELNTQKTATIYAVADIGPLGTTTNFEKLMHGLASVFYDPSDAAPEFDRNLVGET